MQRYTHVCVIPTSLVMGLRHLTLLAAALLSPSCPLSSLKDMQSCMHRALDGKAELLPQPACLCPPGRAWGERAAKRIMHSCAPCLPWPPSRQQLVVRWSHELQVGNQVEGFRHLQITQWPVPVRHHCLLPTSDLHIPGTGRYRFRCMAPVQPHAWARGLGRVTLCTGALIQ